MEHHRFANLWPLMTGGDFETLKADIAAHGQRMPIITYQGQVLDGRNRERACEALGIDPRYEEAEIASEADALGLAFSLNQHRRHLSLEERSFAAAEAATLKRGRNYGVVPEVTNGPIGPLRNSEAVPLDVAAAKLKVSPRSAKRAKVILADGTPDDKQAVLSGKASLARKAEEVGKRKQAAKAEKNRSAPPPRPGPRLAVINPPPLRCLTPEQVDPEFTGTSVEFVDKYGHVQVMTAAEYATMRFGIWAMNMRTMLKDSGRIPGWPEVDHNWLRNPKPSDVAKMAEALAGLRPKFTEAESLLERAEQAVGKATEPAAKAG